MLLVNKLVVVDLRTRGLWSGSRGQPGHQLLAWEADGGRGRGLEREGRVGHVAKYNICLQ